MFSLKHFKLVKELKDIKPKLTWLQFSSSKKSKKDALLSSIIADNKFVAEELKIRAMVEDMLKKEFSEEITKIKSYDFLVDSVVDRLKQKQLADFPSDDLE